MKTNLRRVLTALLLVTLSSCAAVEKGAVKVTPEVLLGILQNMDIGAIGGEGDSVALWLAIGAITLVPFAYPLQRRWRRRREGK
jgi:hypothetical protein